MPHVHTHIVPRYPDDPAPGRPLPDEVFRNAPALADGDLADQVDRLRRHILWASAAEFGRLAGLPGQPSAVNGLICQ